MLIGVPTGISISPLTIFLFTLCFVLVVCSDLLEWLLELVLSLIELFFGESCSSLFIFANPFSFSSLGLASIIASDTTLLNLLEGSLYVLLSTPPVRWLLIPEFWRVRMLRLRSLLLRVIFGKGAPGFLFILDISRSSNCFKPFVDFLFFFLVNPLSSSKNLFLRFWRANSSAWFNPLWEFLFRMESIIAMFLFISSTPGLSCKSVSWIILSSWSSSSWASISCRWISGRFFL